MDHPHTRVVVIVVGGQEDPAETEDAEALVEYIGKKTMLKSFVLSDLTLVNRIVNHLIVNHLGFR